MDHYIDIKIKPDAEMRENILINKVYAKLHKALYTMSSNKIGVSFPECKVVLGRVIRLHGRVEDLSVLQSQNWLGGLVGYCELGEITHVPQSAKHRVISRKQTTMSQAKLNRLIKRGSIPECEVKAYKAKMFSKGLDNPYVELESGSNGNRHRRYFQFGEVMDIPVDGVFDSFGLSKSATVPWF